MKKKVEDITLVGILVALSVVISAWLRIPLFGNVRLDLSYIVLTIAIVRCGKVASMLVGGLSAMIESMVFALNGLSFSWIIANVIIAFIASTFYELSLKKNKEHIFIIGIILGCFIGLAVVKTLLECVLFNIAFIVRVPRNFVAFLGDGICMLIGVLVAKRLPQKND